MAQPGGACRTTLLERCLGLSQHSQEAAYLGRRRRLLLQHSLVLRLALGQPLGFDLQGLLGGSRHRCLLLERLLAPRRLDSEDGSSLLLGLGRQRLAALLDCLLRDFQLPGHFLLQVRRCLRSESAPAGLELRQDGCVRRVLRSPAVLDEGRGGAVDVRLQLLGAADPLEQLVAAGGEDPVDLLVLAVARGANQLVQLVQVRDGPCRQLADARRVSRQRPLADRGHVPGGDGLRDEGLLFARLHGRIRRRCRFGRHVGSFGCRRGGRGRGLSEQAREE